MDLHQLKHCLQAAGVPENEYLLVGLDPPRTVTEGACIVRPNQHSWEVLVWQPVHREPSVTFLSEEDACEYMLNVLAGPRRPGTTPPAPLIGVPEIALDEVTLSEPRPATSSPTSATSSTGASSSSGARGPARRRPAAAAP
jgi:hypothetical protein